MRSRRVSIGNIQIGNSRRVDHNPDDLVPEARDFFLYP